MQSQLFDGCILEFLSVRAELGSMKSTNIKIAQTRRFHPEMLIIIQNSISLHLNAVLIIVQVQLPTLFGTHRNDGWDHFWHNYKVYTYIAQCRNYFDFGMEKQKRYTMPNLIYWWDVPIGDAERASILVKQPTMASSAVLHKRVVTSATFINLRQK
jgi:hypothetical protein